VRVSRLFIHPVKSCRGLAVDEARVTSRGFEHDRRWMVVDWDGKFVTARDDARLLAVRPSIEGRSLVLDAPGAPTLRRPVRASGRRCRVTVWGDECEAVRDDEASAWIGDVLGGPYALVHMPDETRRPVDLDPAEPEYVVSFADGFPFLLLSEASLADLNRRLERPAVMERFRPNLVIDGVAPYAEDELEGFRIGNVWFEGRKRCARCVLTTVDPDTGEAGAEPLRTLRSYRADDGRVLFGMNLVHRGEGTVRVGDPVHAGPSDAGQR
jgi:uncharacterized protein YcbX